LKKNKKLSPYLLKRVIFIINNKETETLKGNEAIIALSYNIKTEINFKVKKAFIFNINKIKKRVNILKKRSDRIFLNSLLKEIKDNII
jgi:hypothetical protein